MNFVSELPVLALISVAALGPFLFAIRNLREWEQRYLVVAFGVRILATIAHVFITERVYGGGDLDLYTQTGMQLASLIWQDPTYWIPPVVHLTLGGDPTIPVLVIGAGTSTGSAAGASGLLIALSGGSIFAACLIMSFLALLGQTLIFRSLVALSQDRYHRALALVTLFFPSVVYWTSSLLKESYAMLGVGLLFWGSFLFIERSKRWAGGTALLAGTAIVGVMKAYILLPYLLALPVWAYAKNVERTGAFIRPAFLLLVAMVGIIGFLGFGEVFPRFAFPNLADETVKLQSAYSDLRAGSTFEYSETDRPDSLLGQIGNSPLALFSALYRPLVLEVHNAPSLFNSLETTVAFALTLWSFWTRGIRRSWALLSETPVLAFCTVFVVVMALGVGLSTPNLGTLSRYRVPMMPFYGTVLVALSIRPRIEAGRPRQEPSRLP